jgi:hypothetical protein
MAPTMFESMIRADCRIPPDEAWCVPASWLELVDKSLFLALVYAKAHPEQFVRMVNLDS